MSGTQIKFNPEKKSIKITDEAEPVNYFFRVFVVLQLFVNSLQIYNNWGKFDSWQFYVFCLLFIAFIGFAAFYFFYNDYRKEIDVDEIQYYREKRFLWSKLRFFKLKDNKIRLINFTKETMASKSLNEYLNQYEIKIKS